MTWFFPMNLKPKNIKATVKKSQNDHPQKANCQKTSGESQLKPRIFFFLDKKKISLHFDFLCFSFTVFFLLQQAKRAFACSVSSNGTICSRLAVKSVFFFLSLSPIFHEHKTGYGHMEISSRASPAILTMIRHSLIVVSVFGSDSRGLL